MRELNANMACSEETRITIRPCCIGHKSECRLLTETQCSFEAGIWHSTKQLCAQVPCLKETCTTYSGVTETGQSKPAQNEIEPPNQWYNFAVEKWEVAVVSTQTHIYTQVPIHCSNFYPLGRYSVHRCSVCSV